MSESRIVRGYRVTGTNLCCWFSSTGTLGSARLFVPSDSVAEEYDVANQLPGLNAENANEYLVELGYTLRPVSEQLAFVCSKLLILFEGTRFQLEAARRWSSGFVLSAIQRRETRMACPRRSFLLFLNESLDFVRVEVAFDLSPEERCSEEGALSSYLSAV